MEVKLEHGDWALDATGLPIRLHGVPALRQLAENLLRIPRGSFVLNPALGSRLHLIRQGCPGDPDAQAAQYAAEALAGLAGVEVLCATVRGQDPFTVTVRLLLYGQEETLEVEF